jgi:hypothetical protein
MTTSTPFPAADSDDEVNPPATDPEDTNPNEDDPDEALSVNPPSPGIPSNADEDADQVAGSRATRPVAGNKD